MNQSDASALLAAIRAAPEDDAPRLVYADWLDEHAQPERAEFIRVQCELARRETPALRRREAELLAAHHDAFAGPLAAPHLRFRFHRGFIVGFGHTGLYWGEEGHGRRRTTTFLRLLPDGSVGSAVTTRSPEEFLVWIARAGVGSTFHHTTGRYSLEAFQFPAAIKFVLSSDGASTVYGGTFQVSHLALDVVAGGIRRFSQQFTHVPDPTLDSFPET